MSLGSSISDMIGSVSGGVASTTEYLFNLPFSAAGIGFHSLFGGNSNPYSVKQWNGIKQLVQNPTIIGEGLFQGASDIYERKGGIYLFGLVGTAVAMTTIPQLNQSAMSLITGQPVVPNVNGSKIPTLESLADDVANSLGGKVSQLKNGYKIEISNGRKPIVIRIMDGASGGRGKPYYRISIDGKGSLTPEGIISSDRGLTHIDLSEHSLSEISNIINNYLGRK